MLTHVKLVQSLHRANPSYFQLCSCSDINCHLHTESSTARCHDSSSSSSNSSKSYTHSNSSSSSSDLKSKSLKSTEKGKGTGSEISKDSDRTATPTPTTSMQGQRTFKEWEIWDDEDPYLPVLSWNEHSKMLLAFAEHVLSRAKELDYQGGTSQNRLEAVKRCNPVPASILRKLIGESTHPSPRRDNYAQISKADWYPAADIAEALFTNKSKFTDQEWYIICVFWFQEWTGYSISEAWKLGVGRKEWEDAVLQEAMDEAEKDDGIWFEGQPRYRRRFKAWSWWKEEGYHDLHYGIGASASRWG
ncbi:hypothetical protein TWF694_007841 [Orbilia ellipsospora]|uniref:Uncharacterized protein n=1 Tax=Orbilia ellipsospora TaxID=2528407 RepID=A0AAV9XJ07_9PEZI